jgi:hypothetical protein
MGGVGLQRDAVRRSVEERMKTARPVSANGPANSIRPRRWPAEDGEGLPTTEDRTGEVINGCVHGHKLTSSRNGGL